MSEVALFAGIALALLAGLLLGFLLGGRKQSELRVALAAAEERGLQAAALRETFGRVEAELAAARAERQKAEIELAEARTQHDSMRRLRDEVVAERETAREGQQRAEGECARLTATLGQLEVEQRKDREANERLLAELREIRDEQKVELKQVAQEALDQAQQKFLETAKRQFESADERTHAKIGALVKPVEETLRRYETRLAEVEKERVDHYAGLREVVEQVKLGQGHVRDETAKLVNALRNSPKARGRWGEQQLKNVLQLAGLSEHADFQTEVSVDTDDGRLRPDVIVRLPGGRQLIIDAKCSLNAYLDANDATDEATRAAGLKAHAGAIRTHALQLGQKSYWAQFGDAADYVVMFIPGEHFLAAALEQDPDLWQWAFERRVLLATPTNLIAIARTVAAVWRQEKLAEEAATIAALGKELHNRLAVMAGHVVKLGRNLELANGAFNNFVGSLESQVLTQARRFESLEVADSGKRIESANVIETHPRPLVKLAAAIEPANDEPEASATA